MIFHIQLLLLFVSASSCVELEADMCLNGEHETQCCYDTYCPEVGDGSFLPSDLSGKCEDLLQSLILSPPLQAVPVRAAAVSGASASSATASTGTVVSRESGARRARSVSSPGRWRSAG